MAIKSIIATVKGEQVKLELNPETGYYERAWGSGADSSFPQENGFFDVSITITDDSTPALTRTINSKDPDFGNNLRLFVVENIDPDIVITAPGENGYITDAVAPEIKFEIYDNKAQPSGYSGIRKDKVVLKIDGVAVENSAIVFEDIVTDGRVSGYKCSYTPATSLNNGEHTITIDAEDNDGNSAETASRTFEIDNQPPGLEVDISNGYVTSNSILKITGRASDKHNPVRVVFTLDTDGQVYEATADAETGLFECDVALKDGNNEIRVVAIDKYGNETTEKVINVVYNSEAPKFAEVEILYNDSQVSVDNKVPTGTQYIIRCKVTTS